ncbi:MAG: hypothetical protein DME19_15590 [Verrucomicrobia bacterium]|nr:MAG: hypothetical protein DME19_15590 [Verrucomicrobiota bacterium]
MRHRNIRTAILSWALTLALGGCEKKHETRAGPTNTPAGGVEHLRQRAEDAVTSTVAHFVQQKEQLQKSLADKMTAFEQQLSDLKAKSEQAGAGARSQWANTLNQLERHKQAAAEKLEQLKQMKNSSAEKWQEFKAGAEAAVADLEKAFKDAFTRARAEDKSDKP